MRRRRRLASVVLAAGLAVVSCAAAAFADLAPSPSPAVASLPLQVTLGGISPLAPQPGNTLTVRGRLSNLSDDEATGITVSLAVSRTKVGSRGEFDQFADDPNGEPPLDATTPASEHVTLPRTQLAARASEGFSITVPVDDLALPEAWQVYEMTVVAAADTDLGHVTEGRLRTFLPWAPLGVSGTGEPTQVAWVWPLIDRPHRTDNGTWLDDGLAASLGGGGRLGGLLAAADAAEHQQPPPAPKPKPRRHGHKRVRAKPVKPKPAIQPVPLTWALDPGLVDDIHAMSLGYSVRTERGTQPGTGKAEAARFLTRLAQDVSSAEFLGVPYGDPDVTAAAHAGLMQDVQGATTHGVGILKDSRIFNVQQSPLPYAWPPDGFADQRALDTFFAAGETTLVLDSQAVPIVGAPPNATPSAHAVITSPRDGTFQALLADHTLNTVIDEGAQPGADSPLATQRVMSELLMIQAELPFNQRSVVLAPDRRWDPTASYAASILADTGKVPWVQPVSLSTVAATPVYDAVKWGPLDYPATERDAQLSPGYLGEVTGLKHLVDTFAEITQPSGAATTTGPELALSFEYGVLRLLSSAWRADPTDADKAQSQLLTTVQQTMSRVHIASRASSLVTLTSHSGTVPVTVANDLDIPVQVVVKVQPDQHLVVKSGRVAQLIPAHRQFPVDIHATAQTSGVFGLTVQLTTKSGRPYGAPVPLRIRSTAYGTTALLITGGATAVLLLTVIVRLIRRARAARRGDAVHA